jgi:hypothetical protein
VQASPSEHVFVSSFVALQPSTGSHVSSVQGLPSSHTVAGPGTHALFAHLSPFVHLSLSSQGAVFAVWMHVLPDPHASSVHGFPSSQLETPTHAPVASHLSPDVQLLLSSHVLPVSGVALHVSVVSSQLAELH